ncbi:MAG: hypothetical protein H6733_09600 [Alphaproteobacteria bacterium]|nr:hypothetical protein [Alphaproteobacteria bacterium]
MSGVLISGATTPLGAALAADLRAHDDGPVLCVGVEADELAADVLPAGVDYQRVDLTRPRHVRSLLFGPVRRLGVSAVVHLAAHRDARREGGRVHRLHVDATRLMLRLADDLPSVRTFVHRSSVLVYKNRTDQADVFREDAPLELSPRAPQWVRDRVEADVTACAHMGTGRVRVAVLRCAELLAPDVGSQLWDYLSGRVCLRPAGFDPMIEVLSVADAVAALRAAVTHGAGGVFNIGGADVLPLSSAIRLSGRDALPVPGPLLGPLYRLRAAVSDRSFRYDVNRHLLHFNGVLDGRRAAEVLGYRPTHPVTWPAPGA